MALPYLGQITLFAGNFAPNGWAFCQGQLLSIAQNSALFSILGTTYGGNGITNFALPDLRGRAPIHRGQGTGLSSLTLGQQGGQETVTLTEGQIALHTHSATTTLFANSATATTTAPGGNVHAAPPRPQYASGTTTPFLGSSSATTTIGSAGGNQAHENRTPYLAINFIIAVEGIFPSLS